MELLELRNRMKKKKPRFCAQDIENRKQIRKRWRKPRGTDSKMRLKLKGHINKVSVGYRSPAEVRGLTRDGMKTKLVSSMSDIDKINSEAAIISSKLGLRKKLLLLRELQKRNIKVINVKDITSFIQDAESSIKARKQKREEREKNLKEKQKEKEKKPKSAELEKKIETEEEKKEREKKEKDKVLTQRD